MVTNESRGHQAAPGSAPPGSLLPGWLRQEALLRGMKQRHLADAELEEPARAACQSLPLQTFKKIKQN